MMSFFTELAMVITDPIDAQSCFFLFIVCFASTLLLFLAKKLLVKSINGLMPRHPPSPWALPVFGHIHLLSSRIHQSFQALASRYGPLMMIRVGASTLYVVSDATVAEQLFKTHDISFASKPSFGSSEYDIYNQSSFFVSEYGPYWRFLKKICMTEILSTSRLKQFGSVRKEEMLKLLETLVKRSTEGEVCDLDTEMTSMTNNTICRMAMSMRCSGSSDQSTKIREFVKGIAKLAGLLGLGEMLGPLKKIDLFGAGRKLRAIMMQYDQLVDGIILEHEESRGGFDRERKDMMDSLLEISKDETAEVKLTRTHIKAFFMDIFTGGTETTSTSTKWALAELINHPDVFNKLREEINRVVGSSRLVEESDVPNLPYLQAVIKENLRLHPPLPLIPRKCRHKCKLNGYDIPTDSRMLINVYAIMRDETLWKNPTQFVPERFLKSENGSIQGDTKDRDFSYLPFGGGRRACPGSALAYAVMQVTIGALVQCFDWKIEGNKNVDMEEGSGFTMDMATPLVCYPVAIVNPLEIADQTAK